MKAKLGAFLTAVAAAAALGSIGTPANALGGDFFTIGQLGHCNVRVRVYGGNSADVTLQVPGDPTAGGALWAAGKVIPFTPINAGSFASCGLTNVSITKQQGASGSFAGSDYLGFAGSGVYKGVPVNFEVAIVGATNSTPLFKYEFKGPVGEAISFKP